MTPQSSNESPAMRGFLLAGYCIAGSLRPPEWIKPPRSGFGLNELLRANATMFIS
jgi:hypothetical protein